MQGEYLPASNVNWAHASEFCRTLTERERNRVVCLRDGCMSCPQ